MTGCRPPTCPWRAFSEPLVAEVLDLAPAFDPPNLAALMEPDPPAILRDAILHYRGALNATWAEDAKKRREEAKRKRDAEAARRKR